MGNKFSMQRLWPMSWQKLAENSSQTLVWVCSLLKKTIFCKLFDEFDNINSHQTLKKPDISVSQNRLLKNESSREMEPSVGSVRSYFSRISQKVKFRFLVKGCCETSLWVLNFVWNSFSLFIYIMRIYIAPVTNQGGGYFMYLQVFWTFFTKLSIPEPENGFWEL